MAKIQMLETPKLNTNINTNSPYLKLGQFLINDSQRGLEFNEKKRQNKQLGDHRINMENIAKDKYDNQVNHNQTMEALTGQQLSNSYEHNQNILIETKRVNDWKMSPNNPANKKKPSMTNTEKMLSAAGINPNSDIGKTFQKALLVKKTLVPTVDSNGNTIMTPISNFMNMGNSGKNELNNVNITKKTNDVNSKDVEDLNEAIKIANSINYAKNNWKEEYTGFADDTMNWIYNKVGVDNPKMRDYNKWVTNLQSVANAARNKSFGAALSGFDIEEFAKEFPSSNAGDGEVLPKIDTKLEILNNALKNTYNTWVENYGKERADKYFSALSNKSFIDNIPSTQNNTPSNISDEDILRAIGLTK